MRSPRRCLEGLIVTEVIRIHDYIQFAFCKDVGISIYDDIEINPSSGELNEFAGKTVGRVVESRDEIEIAFLQGGAIRIDLRPSAYHGPEALQLNRRGYLPVIWNWA